MSEVPTADGAVVGGSPLAGAAFDPDAPELELDDVLDPDAPELDELLEPDVPELDVPASGGKGALHITLMTAKTSAHA